ncbi:hypothetical protein KSP39_PZI007104 [Platanthera zijinensis]|uniref:FAF domain-containing protein n=1 Tax=Platanthera zijinensis TaxID=2320716 RepID=A0AAP0GAA3_9ASPA
MPGWSIPKHIFEIAMPDSRCPWGQLLPSASSASFDIFGEHFYPSSPPSTSPLSEHPTLRQCIDPKHSAAVESFGKLCCIEKPSSPQIPKSTLPDSAAAAMDEGRIEYLRSMSAQERSVAEKLGGNDAGLYKRSYSDVRQRRSLIGGGNRLMQNFPPPITMIGSGGKPRVYFKSLRKDGRFVLKEIRIPTQRLLQATRRDGRLTMRVLRPVDDDDADEAEKNRDGSGEEDDDNS